MQTVPLLLFFYFRLLVPAWSNHVPKSGCGRSCADRQA
jgi:hypothetical protein